MLTRRPLKILSVIVLVLAVSCPLLLAGPGRNKQRRKPKENKTKTEQLSESDSQTTPRSKAESAKPRRRGRRKSEIRNKENARRQKPADEIRHKTKKNRQKHLGLAPKKHARVAVEKPTSIVRKRSSLRTSLITNGDRRKSDSRHRFKHRQRKRKSPLVIYRDRPRLLKRRHRHEHIYTDRHSRLNHRIIWPKFRFVVSYRSGHGLAFRFCYPFHHRKYVFVSLGGYWPANYRHLRYYWYGSHPYYWHGRYPIAQQIGGDTHNYYTYNYYGTEGDGSFDSAALADAGERLAQQPNEQPASQTSADKRFEQAVKAFENGDYQIAADRFDEAIALEPDDIVLGFAYAQALFADASYTRAAQALRSALAKIPSDNQGVFYPRGLYADDDTLFEQIDTLADTATARPFNFDLQLLLGYQLLGIGQIDEALEPLQRALQDRQNAPAAGIMLDLLEKIKNDTTEGTDY